MRRVHVSIAFGNLLNSSSPIMSVSPRNANDKNAGIYFTSLSNPCEKTASPLKMPRAVRSVSFSAMNCESVWLGLPSGMVLTPAFLCAPKPKNYCSGFLGAAG